MLGKKRVASGNRGQTAAPSDVFATRDGWVLVSVVGHPLFERWARLMGEDRWLTDPRYATDETRGEQAVEISERMSAWTRERTTRQVVAELESARIPCGEVLSPAEALVNEQVVDQAFFTPTDYPGLPTPAPVGRTPVDFSRVDTPIRRRAPTLGEHTREVMRELGYEDDAIDGLHERRVV